MSRLMLVVLTGLAAAFLAGCGGGTDGGGQVIPPPEGGGSDTVQVGPLLVRPTSAAGFVAQEIPNPNGPISLVALHGSRITYLASQAMLDRVVFSRGEGGSDHDIWVCNLDGSNAMRVLNNAHQDWHPVWSPDGREIAFDRTPAGQDAEIVVMNADGSGAHALTVNTAVDETPTWSPTGDQIAFSTDRTANREIFAMYASGATPTNLTNDAGFDRDPHWSPNLQNAFIAYRTNRDGNYEIYRMGPRGESPTRLTNTAAQSSNPALARDGLRMAFAEDTPDGSDILLAATSGVGALVPFVALPAVQSEPAWSADGRFICYTSDLDGDPELWLRETAEPYASYRLTSNAVSEFSPNLGSPTLQTDRVIIGPAGSDWGGGNPIWASSDAGIAAYAANGYRNFVRIGIAPAHLPTLQVTPLAATAQNGSIGGHGAPVGVVVEAAEIVNLREDGGRRTTPVLWQLDALDPTAVLLYFDGTTGKLLAALVLRDQNYPAGVGASGSGVTQRIEGSGIAAAGSFAAVFDATGARVADAASAVSITEGGVSVLR